MLREDIKRCLKNTVAPMTLTEFAHLFVNEVSAIEDFYYLCQNKDTGKNISLLFNPHRLNTKTDHSEERNSVSLSMYESIKDKGNEIYTEKIDGMARLFLYNLENGVNDAFYRTVDRGFNGVAKVAEFPPFVARKIYLKYTGMEKRSILDPCAGWGGRMIGASSIPNTRYVACEPCTETYNGLVKLGEWLKSLQPTFDFEIHHIPYEEFETDEKFDIALTSPPYFSTEHYSDEETDSAHKFPQYDLWVEGFYTPLIVNTIDRLKENCVFILNIGDRRYPLTESMKKICKDNNIFVDREYNYLKNINEDGEKFYCLYKSKKEYASTICEATKLW